MVRLWSLTIVVMCPRLSKIMEAYPSVWMRCNDHQFTAWFYLPSLRSLAIWLPTLQDVLVRELERNLGQLHTSAIARSMIGEEQTSRLLSRSHRHSETPPGSVSLMGRESRPRKQTWDSPDRQSSQQYRHRPIDLPGILPTVTCRR